VLSHWAAHGLWRRVAHRLGRSAAHRLRRLALRRRLITVAIRKPEVSYAVASLIDRARGRVWQLRGREPAVTPFWSRRTAFRERVFLEAFADPTCLWPFPRVVGGPDPRRLTGPMVLVSFHLGTVEALGAIFERLPDPRLALWACCPVDRPGIRAVNLNQRGFAFAAKCALDTLRARGFVFSVADGVGESRVEVDVCGRRLAFPRGTFTIARLAGAPLLPLAARWRGPTIEVTSGDPIAPGDESQMAAALARWLEAYLMDHPGEARGDLHRLLHTSPLSNHAVAQGALQSAVSDLPGLRQGDASRRRHHHSVGREAQRV
jgi:hypothetical protein